MQYLPYIINENDQDNKVQEEIEVASALLIALSREGYGHPEAILKAYYPFRVYKSGKEKIIVDLLEFSEAEKKWLVPKNISDILDECACTEDSAELRSWLKKGKEILDEDPEYDSICVEGLIEQENIRLYLLDTNTEKNKIQNELFQPLLTSKRFSSIKKKVKKAYFEVENNLESIIYTKNRAEAQKSVIQENHEKEYSALQKESAKRVDSFKKEMKKAINKIEKALKKDEKAIEDQIQEQIKSKMGKIEETKKEVTKLQKKLESGDRSVKRLLSENEKLMKKYIKEQKALKGELEKSLSKAESGAESEKKEWEDKQTKLIMEEEQLLENLKKTHEQTMNVTLEFLDKIKDVEKTVTENAESLSRILDIQFSKGKDILMPFYVFKYAEDNHGFYPPFKIAEQKSMMNRLKLIISNSLGSKLSKYLSPQTELFTGHMEKVINSFNEESELFEQFTGALPKGNLLESQVTLDRIIVGLYQILEWGWINEKDYIEVQRFIAEKMDSLHGGYIFKVKEQQRDSHIVTPETIEIPASV